MINCPEKHFVHMYTLNLIKVYMHQKTKTYIKQDLGQNVHVSVSKKRFLIQILIDNA